MRFLDQNQPGRSSSYTACVEADFIGCKRKHESSDTDKTMIALTHSPLNKNGRLFEGDIYRCIFTNEKFRILIKISLKFIPKG